MSPSSHHRNHDPGVFVPVSVQHAGVVKGKHFPCYWPFVRRIHRWPVNFPPKGQWRGALIFSLICVWINDWVNNHTAVDLRCYRAHYDVIVMTFDCAQWLASACPYLQDVLLQNVHARAAMLWFVGTEHSYRDFLGTDFLFLKCSFISIGTLERNV